MRRHLAPVLLALTVGVGAFAGCGGEDPTELDVARVASATAAKGTARITSSVSFQGAGLPLPIDVKGRGTTALDAPEGKITFDFGPLLALVGAPSGTDGSLEVRFGAGKLYARPPKLPQLDLQVPGGKDWIALDLAQLAATLGLPTKGLGRLFSLEPAAQLRALKAAKGLKEIGKEEIAGTPTTHYRGTIRLTDLVSTLTPAEQTEVKDALAKLDALSPGSGDTLDDPIPTDLWVDGDGITRRLSATTKIPAQSGTPGGELKQTYELSDFGVALDADPPIAARTFDATKAASEALRGLATAGTTAG